MSLKPFTETLTNLLSRTLEPALRQLSRRSLPSLDGTVELAGLEGPVEVLRDRFGVPQILAETEDDLFFAQGYVHAQDRFFQMELQRRAGHGRLAEILGEDAFPFDRLSRTVGFARIAASVRKPSETLRVLEAYSAGVNALLQAGPLPPELALLRHRPEPWAPLDTAAWSLVMAWSLSSSWESKLLMGGADGEGPEGLLPQTDPGAGSNAWSVAPSRSATRSALLAGDPHLSLGIPCLWYELGLYGGAYEVVGASLPGTPGVVIGHNQEIAWSVTAALTDVQDLYAERFSEQDPSLYEYRGEWRKAEVREERISIRGRREPFTQTVRTTLHGPVVTDAVSVGGASGDLALRWAVPDASVLVESGLAVNRARNREEFLAALAGWTTPNQNFVYADRAGNVGWALAGLVPVRRGFRGDHVLPGPPGNHEWDGFLASAELPRLFGPEDGQVASANEPPPEADRIPGYYLPPYRKNRISKLLNATDNHTLESFRAIQGDLYCEPAHAVARALSRLAPPRGCKEITKELAHWDGHLTADSRPGAIARVALEHLLRRATNGMGTDLSDSSVSNGVATYLGDLVPKVIEGLRGRPDRELADALEDSVSTLEHALGKDPAGWSWGALHVAQFRHPLGVVGILRSFLNRGPLPLGGDANTVRHAAFGQGKSDERGHPRFGPVARGPNYRFVVDTGNWDDSWSVVAPGQSGHPASPYYDDELALWLEVRYRPMVYGRETAELAARHRLILEPL
jgi:penicillin amidase